MLSLTEFQKRIDWIAQSRQTSLIKLKIHLIITQDTELKHDI